MDNEDGYMNDGADIDDKNETWRSTGIGLLIVLVGAAVFFFLKSHEKIVF